MIGVMMLVNKFPPLPAGGAEKQAERLSEYMGARGLRVGVLTRGAEGLPGYEFRDGFWITRIPQFGPGKFKTLSFVLGAMLILWLRRREYQVLHAHLAFGPALAAAIMGRLLGKKVIVKFGNSGPFGDVQVSQQSLFGRLKLKLLRRWVHYSIALDNEMEAELLGACFPRERVLRMVNGIETSTFRHRRSQSEAKALIGMSDKTLLLFVGRLVPQKALGDMLAALKLALEQRPDLHLLLLGQGPEREQLEQRVRELGLEQHATFTGNVSDVQLYLDAADLFLLSSLSEGISNALLEAMAAGLPCVVTAVGGSPEVLDNGACGVLLPPQRPDLLAAEVVRLAADSSERARLGAAAHQRIRNNYDFAVVGNQYYDFYHQLVARQAIAGHLNGKEPLPQTHVLQIIDGLNVGGAEVLLRDVSAGLLKAGYRVTVAYSTPGPLVEQVAALGVPLVRLRRLARVDPLLLLQMILLMRKDPPQVVHTHLFKSDFHGRLAARLCSVPVVVSTLHNSHAWAKNKLLARLYVLTTRFANTLIAVSNEVQEYAVTRTGMPAEKIITIDNGVPLERFLGQEEAGRAVRRELGIADDVPLMGVIARLMPQKDHYNFLQAAALVRQELPAARFLIVGDGPLREELEAQARTLGLANAVIFAGLRSDVPAVLAALDLLVFSSAWEGLPVALLEGMAAARPVVATAVGGVPGVIVDGSTGLLVPPKNPAALAQGCVRVLGDRALGLRMGQAGRARVDAHYSMGAMVRQVAALYEQHLQRTRAGTAVERPTT